jgi:hypothetical protein
VKDVLDPVRHQVQGELVESGTDFEGKVVEFLRPGLVDSDNEVVRYSSHIIFVHWWFIKELIFRFIFDVSGVHL